MRHKSAYTLFQSELFYEAIGDGIFAKHDTIAMVREGGLDFSKIFIRANESQKFAWHEFLAFCHFFGRVCSSEIKNFTC